jgi:hypothetical protein
VKSISGCRLNSSATGYEVVEGFFFFESGNERNIPENVKFVAQMRDFKHSLM